MESGDAPDAEPLSFSYHRALAPMMWVFMAIAIAELVIAHLLIAIWHPRIAIAFSLVSLSGILWLVGLIRSLSRHPLLVSSDAVRFRLGRLRDLTVPIDGIAKLRRHWLPGQHKERSVLTLALLNYPNILVELEAPIALRRRRTIRTIAVRLDDPDGFCRLLGERLAARKQHAGPPGERLAARKQHAGPPAWFA